MWARNSAQRMFMESMSVKARIVLVIVELGDGCGGSLRRSLPLCLKCFETKERIENIKAQ